MREQVVQNIPRSSNETTPQVVHALRKALHNLSLFTRHNAAEPIPHLASLDLKEGELVGNGEVSRQSMINLAHCFVTALLSDSVRQRQEKRKNLLQIEILKAIEIVKNCYPLLNRLNEGDETQQKLAETALTTIDQFNEVMARTKKTPPTFGQRFVRFLFKQSGLGLDGELAGKTIELPLPASLECESPHKIDFTLHHCASLACYKVSSFAFPAHLSPTQQEVDAFRMKAITTIRNYGFPSTSLSEALKAMREAPVQGTTNNCSTNSTIVTFRQTLEPFPGETIVLEGSFNRNAHNAVSSVPIPDSFKLYSKSSQTGFPHPLQHNGWGLSDKILPPCPDALERLPLYRVLFEQKRKIAMSLLPHGWRLPHAKLLMEIKLNVFETHKTELLALHQRLAQSLANAAGVEKNNPIQDIIRNLFKHLKDEPNAIERLSHAYQCIAEVYCSRPSEQLQHQWLEMKTSDTWQSMEPQHRLESATHLLQNALTQSIQTLREGDLAYFSAPVADYILAMGDLIGDAARELILQYMSEKMGYEPEALTTFAQKIQANAFKQLMSFLVDMEFDRELSDEERRIRVRDRLIQALESDIACFEDVVPLRSGRSVSSLARELQGYYDNRTRRNLVIGYDN